MSLFPQTFYGGYGLGGFALGQIAQIQDAPAPPVDVPVEPKEGIDRASTVWTVTAARGYFPGFDKAPPPSISTWWMMRRYATIVLAHTIVTAPVLAGAQTVEIIGESDDELETLKTEAEGWLLPLMADLLPAAMESLHFGHWLQEVIWDVVEGNIQPVGFCSFLPGQAVLFRDHYNRFAGFKVNEEYRDARYGFLAVNEPHIDPIYGYSRNENCREEWWRSRKSAENADKLELKASGRQMKIGVPMASFTDDSGNPVLSKAAVQTIVNAAAQGDAFTVPLTPFDKSSIKVNPALADIEAVKTEVFDWGNNAPSLAAHLERLSRLDKDIVRAWHRPEREAMEGQHGTKAESGVHGQIGVTDSELVANSILRQFSRQVLDRWVVQRKGPQYAGRLQVIQQPLSDPQQEFLQQAALALIADTTTGPDMAVNIDKRALLDGLEMPQVSEEEAAAAKTEMEAKQAAADKAKADAIKQQPSQNGNGQVPVKIAASGNGHKMNAVDLFHRVLELGGDE